MSKDIFEIYKNNKDVCLDLYDYLTKKLTWNARLELSKAMLKIVDKAKELDND